MKLSNVLKNSVSGLVALACLSGSLQVVAQETVLPESAISSIAEADNVAGDDPLLRIMRTYHCYYVDPEDASFRPSPSDRNDLLFGTKFLDDVWYLGYMNVATYAIETDEGLVLLDGGADPDDGPKFEAWLEEADFTPQDIKYIIVTHEHGDHYGAVPHLKSLNPYIKLIGGAAAEWTEEMAPFADMDIEISERTEVEIGGKTFVFMPTPGHTPGTISAFIPLMVQGEEYLASFWGGKGMRPNIERTQVMLESVKAFSAESDALGVRVPLNTHGWGDATISRMINSILVPRDPNPFIMTEEQSQANNKILEHCTSAYLDAVVSGAIKPRN